MASEAKRGCGYRKVGGLYLVDVGAGSGCCKMPLALSICPCCNQGIKQTRGWTWIDAAKMFPSGGCVSDGLNKATCPVVNPALMGRVGLVWIGEKFYKRPVDFLNEAANIGISRRLPAVPRGFKAGETWVLFAHPKAFSLSRKVVAVDAPIDGVRLPWAVATPDGERIEGEAFSTLELATARAASLDLSEPLYGPGVIRVTRPKGFEKIVKQSDYDAALADKASWVELEKALPKEEVVKSALLEEFETDAKRGVTWVPVPDDDPDHQGTVYDKGKEEATA